VYVVTGVLALTGDSSLRGDGVTIHLACAGFPSPCGVGESGASFAASGNAIVELTAPGGAAGGGIAVFLARGNGSPLALSGSARLAVTGAVYGRSSALRLSGSSALESRGGSVVVAALAMSGNSSVDLDAP
jgi:hypothetical protein